MPQRVVYMFPYVRTKLDPNYPCDIEPCLRVAAINMFQTELALIKMIQMKRETLGHKVQYIVVQS